MSTPAEGVPLVIVAYEDIYTSIAMQLGGLDDAYQQRSAAVLLSPAVLERLGLSDGDLVELSSGAGAVVVKARSDSACEEDTGLMPVSLYSNYLASYDPSQGRLPNLKHIAVTARRAKSDITPLSDLLVRKPGG
jgi:formylmethanofuran dehydrogenase subunit D